MQKGFLDMKRLVALAAVVAACVSGICVAAYYETRRDRPEAEDALVTLSDHLIVIGLISAGETRNASRFLTRMADADVMRLMMIDGGDGSNSEDRRRVLRSYAEFRRNNPQFYGVPYYVDESSRAEYEDNLKRIEVFLESAGQAQSKSIK
jgi:hypothetical protein